MAKRKKDIRTNKDLRNTKDRATRTPLNTGGELRCSRGLIDKLERFTIELYTVRDCCLTPSEPFFSYIMGRASCISMKWWWCLPCTKPTRLDFQNAGPLEQQSVGQTCCPTHTHYPDSEPTSRSSYSFILRVEVGGSKYQFSRKLSLVLRDQGSNPWSINTAA